MARARSNNSTPQSDSLFGAAILSAIFHAGALFAALVVWPMVAPPMELPSDVVPVDLLTVADQTNIMAQQQDEPQKLDEAPTPEPPPEPPQQEAEAQALAPEPPPPPPPEEPAPEAEPEKPEPPKPEPPKPEERRFALATPRAKPKPEKPKEKFDVDKILKGLDSLPEEPKEAKAAPSKADRAVKAVGAQSAMTMSEIDALKGQLAKCWNVPVGAPDPAALVFRVRVFLNEDGTVASPPQLLDQGRLGDPYFRAAADSAIRAVHICGPYNLPPEKYASWNEIVITFDPRQMAGY
ncbi:MAG: hypothetical protein KBA31_21575 [Alphaproteobacteria bacterium]|nr:hypothetical protein [Alphaproteobacteria bacterium]